MTDSFVALYTPYSSLCLAVYAPKLYCSYIYFTFLKSSLSSCGIREHNALHKHRTLCSFLFQQILIYTHYVKLINTKPFYYYCVRDVCRACLLVAKTSYGTASSFHVHSTECINGGNLKRLAVHFVQC